MAEVLSYQPGHDGTGGDLTIILYQMKLDKANQMVKEYGKFANYQIIFNESTVAF